MMSPEEESRIPQTDDLAATENSLTVTASEVGSVAHDGERDRMLFGYAGARPI